MIKSKIILDIHKTLGDKKITFNNKITLGDLINLIKCNTTNIETDKIVLIDSTNKACIKPKYIIFGLKKKCSNICIIGSSKEDKYTIMHSRDFLYVNCYLNIIKVIDFIKLLTFLKIISFYSIEDSIIEIDDKYILKIISF